MTKDDDKPVGIAKAPCKSCPYRKDVPSGIWAEHEYEKLPIYDGTIAEQLLKGYGGLFLCHQRDGCVCAGWVATHGDNLAALRFIALGISKDRVDPEVFGYVSPVPVFASGAEACAHGLRDMDEPSAKARRTVDRLSRKIEQADVEDPQDRAKRRKS